jgi:hypothetical protein
MSSSVSSSSVTSSTVARLDPDEVLDCVGGALTIDKVGVTGASAMVVRAAGGAAGPVENAVVVVVLVDVEAVRLEGFL